MRGARHVNIVNETLNGFTMNFNLGPHFTCVFFFYSNAVLEKVKYYLD